jgi:hypothetical protein
MLIGFHRGGLFELLLLKEEREEEEKKKKRRKKKKDNNNKNKKNNNNSNKKKKKKKSEYNKLIHPKTKREKRNRGREREKIDRIAFFLPATYKLTIEVLPSSSLSTPPHV